MNAIEIALFILCLVGFLAFRIRSYRLTASSRTGRNARMHRIKNASRMVQLFVVFSLLLGGYWLGAFLFDWPFFFQDKVRIVISQGHIYSSRAEMPPPIFALWLVKIALGVGFSLVVLALFRLYGQGIVFSAKNVRYIRFLGYGLIIGWGIDYQLQSTLNDMALSTTPLLVGLLIIFGAWIMDEGRMIQEEQALTV